MTLLIGAISTCGVVLTADGRCTKEEDGCIDIDDEFQKIFLPPEGNPSMAIAHHGQNEIAAHGVERVVERFYQSSVDTIREADIHRVAECLARYLDRDAKATLAELGGEIVIGFWIAGYGQHERNPALYEVCWEQHRHGPSIEKRPLENYGVIWGGSGQKYVQGDDTNVCRVSRGTGVGSLKQCCDDIYRQAQERQSASLGEEFGGWKHQLSIRKSGYHWYIPPRQRLL